MSTWVGVAVWAVVLTMWGFMIMYAIGSSVTPLSNCKAAGYVGPELNLCVSEKMKESR